MPETGYVANEGSAKERKRAYDREYQRQRYLELVGDGGRREKETIRQRAKQKRRREERRILLDGLKNAPCQDCGGRFPPECMDFDHRDPTQKKWTVSKMLGASISNIRTEVAKCDLVCANCHRIRTWRHRG